jgi:hypothetical protein
VIYRFRIGPALAVLATAITVAGCGDNHESPPKAPPGPQSVIRSTPENALKQLEYVYTKRDSTGIKALYDSTYAGTSTDETALPGSQVLNFTYADEVEHVAAMARAREISSVILSFGTLTRLPSNDVSHPEWATIQIAGSNMSLEIDALDAVELHASGISESFSFKPTTPDSTSPTDTTWKIVRWSELYVGGGP